MFSVRLKLQLITVFALLFLINSTSFFFIAFSQPLADETMPKDETTSENEKPSPQTSKVKKPAKKSLYKSQEPHLDESSKLGSVEKDKEKTDSKVISEIPTAPAFVKNNQLPLPVEKNDPQDKFPSIGQMEILMFGQDSPAVSVEDRLDKLEKVIFKTKYSQFDIEKRIQQLKDVLIGSNNMPQVKDGESDYIDLRNIHHNVDKDITVSHLDETKQSDFFHNISQYNLNDPLTDSALEKFGLVVLNEVRSEQGLEDLTWDELAYKVAGQQAFDLSSRHVVSHQNSNGWNPDLRYTQIGGNNAITESVMMFKTAQKLHQNRELVVKMLELLNARQDDHDVLFSKHATGFALAFHWSDDHSRLICCTETVTSHGKVSALPKIVNVGDKIEVKGKLDGPYRFQKVTLSWEGEPTLPDNTDEQDEALPYFPPLDYEAHAVRSEHDWEKEIRILQIVGISAAIAGGLFIPPVALAAPLIAASSGIPRPKPISDIPVKGGVKTDGKTFSGKIVLSNQGKVGIYYVTVWAALANSPELVPVSRQAIIVHKLAIKESKGNLISSNKASKTVVGKRNEEPN